MKYLTFAVIALVSMLFGSWLNSQGAEYEIIRDLAAENQRLRLFNAREVRRYQKPAAVPRGTQNAEQILGTPAKLIAAVWRQENGPPDIETGVLGKTAYFSKNSPIEDWPALETARTLNIYAWDWMQNTPEGRKAMEKVIRYAAKSYTGNVMPDAWHKNVLKIYKEK